MHINPRHPQLSPLRPQLSPEALQWSLAASAAAAISYADRGTSAITASFLLQDLQWSESELGQVQSAFFVGYALTQVLGGALGGSGLNDRETGRGGYRAVLPISLFFTGVATLLFPLASTAAGPHGAAIDRFCLGLFEGILLPAAMAGVSHTTKSLADTYSVSSEGYSEDSHSTFCLDTAASDGNEAIANKATASSIVIAGCYLGSAWAYLVAWALFSEKSQIQLLNFGYQGSIWPWIFYVNGIISMICIVAFRKEFDWFHLGTMQEQDLDDLLTGSQSFKANATTSSAQRTTLWKDILTISKDTLSSKSGRAILAAQIGQGALLYSIASWGPLYLERLGLESDSTTTSTQQSHPTKSLDSTPTPEISQVALTASYAAASLILPQLTQAIVGISVGSTADRLSSLIGTRLTRRILQLLSGLGPALILVYLSSLGSTSDRGDSSSNDFHLLSPTFLFGVAQTISALSLGAVSVSHLDIATPSKAGAVYALGNVVSAVSGSVMVNLFGQSLENERRVHEKDGTDNSGPSYFLVGGQEEFSFPFRVVAFLSAVGSIVYGFTVDVELEIDCDKNQNGTQASC